MIDTTEIRNSADLSNPKFGIGEAINTIELLCDRVDELERRLKQFSDAIFDRLDLSSFPKLSNNDLTDAPFKSGVEILENSTDETFRKETARKFFLAGHTSMWGFGDMERAMELSIELADDFIARLKRGRK